MQAYYRASQPYALAAVSIGLAIGIRLLIDPLVGQSFPFATIFLAIMVTAWLGGIKPALLALVLGGIGAVFLLQRHSAGGILNPADQFGLALYAIVGGGLASLGGSLHASRCEAQQRTQESLHRQLELEQAVQKRTSAEVQLQESQRRLEEQSERLRVTLSSIGDGVIATDNDGRISFINQVAVDLTGWPNAEACGRELVEIFRIINETTRLPVENPVAKVLEEGRVVGLANHTLLIHRDGSETPIADSAAPIRDAAGVLVGVVLVFRDVSEQRQTEEARARLAAIVNSSEDAIIVKSFEGLITSWNSGAQQLYGYSAEEMIGRPFAVLCPPHEPSEVPELLEKIRRGTPQDHYETIRVTKDGRRIRVSARISAVKNDAGEVTGVAVIARDVTHRDRAERLRNARLAVTQILAHATSIEEAIPQVLTTFGTHLQWEVGSYWEVDEDAVWLRCRTTWQHDAADSNQYQEFEAATRGLTLRLHQGLPGRVWETGQPCWIVDVESDPNFPRAAEARRAFLRTAFALPVHVGEHVFGVLEFFSHDIRQADLDLLEMVSTLGWHLGQFIERQKAEQALRQSEKELSDFFDNATVGLHWVGPDGIILRVNQEELDMLGYERDEYLGRHIAEIHTDQEVIGDILRRLTAGERLQDYPAQLKAKDGSVCDVLIDSSVMWKDGEFIHTRCFTRDVTARRRNEELLQFLADASVALASLVDYQSTLHKVAQLSVPHFADWCTIDMLDDQGKLQRVAVVHKDLAKVNRAKELVQQHSPEAGATTGVWHILRTGATELIPEISEELLADAVKDEKFREILRELGLRSYVGVPLQLRGKPIGVISFFTAESGRNYSMADAKIAQDLASRAAIAIENARLYAELHDASRRKDEFLAMLAHELRNPLAPLRNGLEIMHLVRDDPAALDEARDIMQRQLDQMVRLVDDLLDISRITRGKLELRKERVALAAIVDTAIETSRPVIDAARHRFSVSLPSEPIELQADETRLAQVFANLLNNSAKYTTPGGQIELIATREGNEILVTVRDSGIGISPDMLPRIFEMFTQADRSIDRAQGGLGIGLTLVRRLTEMHGGRVEARSAGLGQGSEFSIRLPILATSADAISIKPTTLSATGLTQRRILVVDDNRDSAVTLSMILRLMGNEIETAFDGAAALTAADQFRPDLIVLDIGLPKVNGYEVARHLREQPWAQDITLVALTGWGQEEDRRRSKQAGFNHHFVKPLDIADLKRVLSDGQVASTT